MIYKFDYVFRSAIAKTVENGVQIPAIGYNLFDLVYQHVFFLTRDKYDRFRHDRLPISSRLVWDKDRRLLRSRELFPPIQWP